MKRYFILILVLIAVSCGGDELHKKVISSFPDGVPSTVEYYKWIGNNELLVKRVRFYRNAEKQEEGEFLNGQKHGKWTYWYENGQKWSEGYFKNGERDGESTVWYKSGKIQYTGFYTNGQTDKVWIFYDGVGKKIKEVVYEKGEKVSETDL